MRLWESSYNSIEIDSGDSEEEEPKGFLSTTERKGTRLPSKTFVLEENSKLMTSKRGRQNREETLEGACSLIVWEEDHTDKVLVSNL